MDFLIVFLASTAILFVGSAIHYDTLYHNYKTLVELNIVEIIVPEFINERPFGVTNPRRKEAILRKILINVNSRITNVLGTSFPYKNTTDLLEIYQQCMSEFEDRYYKYFKGIPIEEVKGWDKIMVIAKTIQDKGLDEACRDLASPDIIQELNEYTLSIQNSNIKRD